MSAEVKETTNDGDQIACPVCGAMHRDLWDFHWGDQEDEAVWVDCECGVSFELLRNLSVSYVARFFPQNKRT